jgi:GMP synthase-like glutamine amidotransferase
MHITCLQHSAGEGPGCLADWARQRGHAFRSVMLHQGDLLPDTDSTDWLIVLGGPMGVHDEPRYPWLGDEKTFIRLNLRAGHTVLGICLGAQLIAHVLGARVARSSQPELGWLPIVTTPEARGRFPLLPETLQALCWHNDTFDIPLGAVPLGSSEACRNQGFFLGDRTLGLQFHLEWSHPDIRRLVASSGEEFTRAGKHIQTPSEVLAPVSWVQRANALMVGLLEALPA